MKLTTLKWIWNQTVPDADWLKRQGAQSPIVWQAQLTDAPAVEAHLISLLSSDERVRLARLRQRDDQRRFWVGRGLLRLLLGAHLNLPPARIEFGFGPFGKPFVRGQNPIHFNVSHSGEVVLLAFDAKREVGMDVEQMRWSPDLKNVARQLLSATEYDRWLSLEETGQCRIFFREWTRREAALKATGVGLAERQAFATPSRLDWFELALPDGYQGFVCRERE